MSSLGGCERMEMRYCGSTETGAGTAGKGGKFWAKEEGSSGKGDAGMARERGRGEGPADILSQMSLKSRTESKRTSKSKRASSWSSSKGDIAGRREERPCSRAGPESRGGGA